jgi:alcohol dehydrogenase class IV
MPYVLAHNLAAAEGRLAALARYLDLPEQSAEAVVDWVLDLRKRIGIPHTLKEIGVDPGVIAEAAPMAEHDPSNGGNPVPLDASGYAALYEKAISGMV